MAEPQRFGKYELQERLGRGGMGEVWKARDTQLRRYVAIKLLHNNLQSDPDFITHFTREAQFVASFHHPNIVQIHDFQFTKTPEGDQTIAYMVMDYIDGGTLADYIRNTSRKNVFPSADDIIAIFTGISLGLDYAHQKGMIHRDIKPANILLDKHNLIRGPMGEPIISDFGIAKLHGTVAGTLTKVMLGTPLYISPEQAQGLPGDERTDLYSLGIIMYEIATGVTPFRGDSPIAIMMQHLREMPTPPTLINPHIPPVLSEVILRSIAKDPELRFPTASAMTIALAQALNVPVPATLHRSSRVNVETATNPLQPLNSPSTAAPLSPLLTASPAFTPLPDKIEERLLAVPEHYPPAINHPLSTSAGPVPLPPLSSSPPIAQSPPIAVKPRKKALYQVMALAACLVVLASIGAFALLHSLGQKDTTLSIHLSNLVVGHITFVKSQNAPQGVFDQVQVNLQNISAPPADMVYYAWVMESTAPEVHVYPHWLLHVKQGIIQDFYAGDGQHTNLLVSGYVFLITEEDATSTPNVPYPDLSKHIYYAVISQASTVTFQVRICPSDSTGNPCS